MKILSIFNAKSEGSKADRTAAQLLVREKFQVFTNLSNVFVNVIPRGLDSQEMTSYNLFRSLNFPAVSGTIGALSVDNSIIKVSRLFYFCSLQRVQDIRAAKREWS